MDVPSIVRFSEMKKKRNKLSSSQKNMNNIQADHDLKLECHPSAEICPVALQIRAHFSHLKAAEGYISDPKFSFLRGQTLELRHHPGQFLKRCPGTKGDYLCCG